MKENNPNLEYEFFEQQEQELEGKYDNGKPEWAPTTESVLIEKLFEKFEALERKIDLIFGDYVLVNGQFKSIKR